MTKRTVLEVYALAVCFFTVACFAIVLGLTLYDVVGIADPGFTMKAYIHKQHADNDRYWESLKSERGAKDDAAEHTRDRPIDSELTRRREQSYAVELASESRESKQGLVQHAIVLIVDILIFFPHWIVAKRARLDSATGGRGENS